jgi:hypothetical protein
MDVGGWLKGLGLGQDEALFSAIDIDADILPELTDVDLKELGVPLGHCKRLLRAISGLAAAEISAVPSASTGATPQDAAERCRLTVMFCDLVGSTPLSTLDGAVLISNRVFGAMPRRTGRIGFALSKSPRRSRGVGRV